MSQTTISAMDAAKRWSPTAPLIARKDCSRFAVASLSPEPLKLKVAILIARNDDLWFSVAPAQNMDFIVYGVMNKLL